MSEQEDRLLELLTEKVERRLTPAGREELERLLKEHPEYHRHDLDYAAAAVHLALDPPGEEMPEHLKARVVGAVLSQASQRGGSPVPAADPPLPAVAANDDAPKGGRLLMYSGWVAAAAAFAVAVFAAWPRLVPEPEVREPPATVARAELLSAGATVVASFKPTEDPLGGKVGGDVVWHAAKNTGFMRFTGLPQNDPTEAQYQLWIFDKERDERYPVDGGVFDVSADGEVIVPIKARLPVAEPTLFAITLEKPGGVVVSTRERLVTLGAVTG